MTPAGAPPESCAVAFKEWAGVCEALAEGRQALILRKGGIAEGPGGFAPEHDAFWLYPTRVHEAEQGLRPDFAFTPRGPAEPDTVALGLLATVQEIGFLEREADLAALQDLHVWTAETVSKRFHYRRPGLWVLGVRVYRLEPPHAVAVTPEHLGCKTWVPLDPPPATSGLAPVLDDEESSRRMARLRAVLNPDR